MVTFKLAQVSFLLDQLNMVMFTVKAPLVSNVVGRADDTSTMSASETALVVWSSIHRYLNNRFVCSLVRYTKHGMLSAG